MPAAAPATAADPRVAAFCSPDGPEVFSGIIYQSQVWAADPFDVETVHPEARAAFARLLSRAAPADRPPHGRSLLLLGEGGSGKTHLMRAFRAAAHSAGEGYCGYLQMTSRSGNYARYVLGNLVDSLEHPYRPDSHATGLARLARGLLDALDPIPEPDRRRLYEDDLEPGELARLVFRFADVAVQLPAFAGHDINLLRAVLYLLPNDGRIRPNVLNWLRCEDLTAYDRDALGGLVPRPGPEMPLKTVVGLGKLMAAVHSAALVLLVDQMEEVIELARGDSRPGELFRTAVNTLIDVADALPSAMVVMGCLEDLYEKEGRPALPGPKLDRLERDPEPIRLSSKRGPDEVRAIAARCLGVLFEAAGLATDPQTPTAPYTAAHIAPLAGLRTRDVLDFLRTHREACVRAGRWVEPVGAPPTPPPPPVTDLGQRWNDALNAARPPLADEPELAGALAWAVRTATAEMPHGILLGADADGRFVEVEVTAGDAVDRNLVAVCDKGAGRRARPADRRGGEAGG